MTPAEIAALRALMARATTAPWYIGDINTNPDEGVLGEVAIMSRDPQSITGVRCPAVALPFMSGASPIGPAITMSNAELIIAAVNALPALLSLAEDAARMRAALEEVHKCGNGGAKLSRKASDMVRAALAKDAGQ